MTLNVFINPIWHVPTTVTTVMFPITSYMFTIMTLDMLASLTSSTSQATMYTSSILQVATSSISQAATSLISQSATSSISQAATSSMSQVATSSTSQAATASILPTVMSSMHCIS